MSADAIIQKYSEALAEFTAQGKTGVLAFEVDAVAKVFAAAPAQEFFNSPFNSVEQKVSVAKASLEGKCLPEVFNFFVMLVENERVGLVTKINERFQEIVRSQSGEDQGILYSAIAPTESFKNQVEQKLSESLKRKVTLKAIHDPSLISGYKVTVGSWTIDDSALFHINKLKEEISRKI
jgi:F-type H+-transporting ATPase subunit delta